MNDTPTFKLREDAITALLEEQERAHGADVFVAAVAEFFMRGRTSMLKRVVAITSVRGRRAAAKRQAAKRKAKKAAELAAQQQQEAPP